VIPSGSVRGKSMQMLWNHYRQTINWRILYLSWLRRGDAGHAVYVRDIPGKKLDMPGGSERCVPSVRPPLATAGCVLL
jgi:hypothetical protein